MKHVAILGLGPTAHQFLRLATGLGGRSAYCDEVWTINALGDVLASDLVFHMDDVRVQQIRADAKPESNIARMLAWMRTYRGRIITSRAHPDFPCLVEFPLADLLNAYPCGYFNSTAAYAVAYAVHDVEVTKISVFGMDFTYPNAHDAEKGRACVEFWLGIAHSRGIELAMPRQTSLMDALAPRTERFYGYDCVDLGIARDADGKIAVTFTERAEVPSAEEIEDRYDHSRHPNPLVEDAQAGGSSAATVEAPPLIAEAA